MAISPFSSSNTPLTIPSFDFNSLSSFYTTGAFMGNAKHADKLASGALKDILSIDPKAPIAPWQLTQIKEGAVIDRVFSGAPLIDLKDPLFNRSDIDDNFKNMFALYKGLARVEELVEFAGTKDGNRLSALLQRQLDGYVKEVKTFLGETQFADISIVPELTTDTLKSTIVIPPVSADNAYVGAVVAADTTTAVAGLTAADAFTVAVTRSGVTTDVTVNLSSAASLGLADIATQINSDLVAAGFSSTFKTKYHADGKFGLQADFASGEALSLSHAAAAESKAVYVTGRAGAGQYADGFVTKIEDLDSADPTQAFYNNISSTYDGAFHMDSANGVAVDSVGNVYSVGSTEGDMDGMVNVDGSDIFLKKYDASGNLLFSRMVGSNQSATGFKVTVDASDNVIIAGQTGGALNQAAFDFGLDNFVSKFDSEGEELWTRQLGPSASDGALDVTVDTSGNIYTSGFTYGAMTTSETYNGGSDAYVTKLDANGVLQFHKQFSGAGDEKATAIAINSGGDILVAGMSDANGFLRKYNAADASLAHDTDLGAIGTDGDITGIAIDSNNDVYLSGFSSNAALSGTVTNAHSGGADGFVLQIDDQAAAAVVNGSESKVTVEADDSFGFLAFKINKILGIQGLASLDQEVDNRTFQIKARQGAEIVIRGGPGNFNALPGMGLIETRLFGKFEEGDRIGELSADDKAFALGLVGNLTIGTFDQATETLSLC